MHRRLIHAADSRPGVRVGPFSCAAEAARRAPGVPGSARGSRRGPPGFGLVPSGSSRSRCKTDSADRSRAVHRPGFRKTPSRIACVAFRQSGSTSGPSGCSDALEGPLWRFSRGRGPVGPVKKAGSPRGPQRPPGCPASLARITVRGRRLASGHFLRSRSSRRSLASRSNFSNCSSATCRWNSASCHRADIESADAAIV
jgi:hypothetical protein